MANSKSFKLPQAFLNQLKEFTNGFHLVVIDDNNNFKTYVYYPDESSELSLINYMDIQSSTLQEMIRQQAVDNALDSMEEDDDCETS